MSSVPIIPASFFAMVMGLSGLSNAWRTAHQVWRLPSIVGESLALLAIVVWACLIAFYGLKWLVARDEAMSEVAHPVQCCFVGLAGVATMLAAGDLLPYSHTTSEVLLGAGAAFHALVRGMVHRLPV